MTEARLSTRLGLGTVGTVGLVLLLGAGVSGCGSDTAPTTGAPEAETGAVAGAGATGTPPAATPRDPSPAAQPPAANTPGNAPGTPSAQQPNTDPQMQPAANGGMMPMPMATPMATPATPPADPNAAPMGKPLAMDECGLKTNYPGDNYCIKAPDPDKGFQLHVGPKDYNNPEPQYVLAPGQEVTSDFEVTSPNTETKYFYYRQFRMRPGAHHNIVSNLAGGGLDMGRRIGTSNHLAEDSPKGGIIAPENEGVGIEIAANQRIRVNLHSINVTDKPMIREVWINFWYKDAAEVTEPVEQMFQTGDTTFAIQPGEDTTLGPFSCTIQGEGRMLWFYGHRHASNKRFSAWRVRNGQRDLFYEGLNWEDPIVLEYSSTVKNPVPDREKHVEGGWTGILDMKPGDVLEWECHIVNKSDQVLRFTNETFTGEMCIMDAELVGANCPAFGGRAGAGTPPAFPR